MNFAFLQHAIEAALVPDLAVAVIAVREVYKGQLSFDRIESFLARVFRSGRVQLPYDSLVVIRF